MATSENMDELNGSILNSLLFLVRAPYMLVSPSWRDNVKVLFTNNNVRVITNKDCTLPYADHEQRAVVIGWPFCERVWAYSSAHLAMLDWDKEHGAEKNTVQSFLDDPKNQGQLALIKWGMKFEKTGAREYWPSSSPRPPQPPNKIWSNAWAREFLKPEMKQSFEGRASVFFLYAIGWIVFHETAHIVENHDTRTHRIRLEHLLEQEADHWAAETILLVEDGRKEDLIDRELGVLFAYVILASLYLRPILEGSVERTHANALTRLRRFLLTFVSRDSHLWRAASLLLELHMRINNFPIPVNIPLGTDEYLCKIYESLGGTVLNPRVDEGANKQSL